MNAGAYNQLEQTFTLDDLQAVATLIGKKPKRENNRFIKHRPHPSFLKSTWNQQIYIVNSLHKKTGNGYLIKTWEAKLIGLQNSLPFSPTSIILHYTKCSTQVFNIPLRVVLPEQLGPWQPPLQRRWWAEVRPQCSPGTPSTGASAERQWGWGTGHSW